MRVLLTAIENTQGGVIEEKETSLNFKPEFILFT